jgi:hypothetical protein
MEGKREFSLADAARIRTLLERTRAATGRAQQPFRRELRALGFYSPDWDRSGRGYTAEQFDGLIRDGLVAIIGR